MNKVELAKLIGLHKTGYDQLISKHDIFNLVENEWMTISETFCGGIEVEVEQEDFSKDKLDINLTGLERDIDIKVCIKQVEGLLWERAADEYLKRVHNAAMLVGGK